MTKLSFAVLDQWLARRKPGNDLVLVAALGIDGEGHKNPLALIEGATEEHRRRAGTHRQPDRARA